MMLVVVLVWIVVVVVRRKEKDSKFAVVLFGLCWLCEETEPCGDQIEPLECAGVSAQ